MVTHAVKELRIHLGESQQAFATRLGLSIRAIANYEKDRIPSNLALQVLLREAVAAQREDLADEFRTELWRKDPIPGFTDEQAAWSRVLADVIAGAQVQEVRERWGTIRTLMYQCVDLLMREAQERNDPDLAEIAHAGRGHLLVASVTSKVRDNDRQKEQLG